MKADEPKALAAFSQGADGFKDRDLYVFCACGTMARSTRISIQHRSVGTSRDLYDVDGVAFGQEMMAIATEGQMIGVSYMWPEPGSHVPTAKISFVTRVADQIVRCWLLQVKL